MSGQDTYDDRNGDDAVAAEYVLGLLEGEAQIKAKHRIQTEPAFADMVAEWQEKLSSLNDEFTPVAPPAATFSQIESRLFEGEHSPGTFARLWASATLWRGVAVVALVFVVALVSGQFTPQQQREIQLIAALEPATADHKFIAAFAANGNEIRVEQTAGPEVAKTSDFELWVIAAGNGPISLGVINPTGTAHKVAADIASLLTEGATLAISLEPKGGSQTGSPTGPVLAAGKILEL